MLLPPTHPPIIPSHYSLRYPLIISIHPLLSSTHPPISSTHLHSLPHNHPYDISYIPLSPHYPDNLHRLSPLLILIFSLVYNPPTSSDISHSYPYNIPPHHLSLTPSNYIQLTYSSAIPRNHHTTAIANQPPHRDRYPITTRQL